MKSRIASFRVFEILDSRWIALPGPGYAGGIDVEICIVEKRVNESDIL